MLGTMYDLSVGEEIYSLGIILLFLFYFLVSIS